MTRDSHPTQAGLAAQLGFAMDRASFAAKVVLAAAVERDERVVAEHVARFNASNEAAEFQKSVYRSRTGRGLP